MRKHEPCLAITLVNPLRPQEAGSYMWCTRDSHSAGMHIDYGGLWWLGSKEQLVDPTPEMIQWRTGDEMAVKAVTGRLLG